MLVEQLLYNGVQTYLYNIQCCSMMLVHQFLHKDVLHNDTCTTVLAQGCVAQWYLYNLQCCTMILVQSRMMHNDTCTTAANLKPVCPSSLADLSHSIRHSPTYPTNNCFAHQSFLKTEPGLFLQQLEQNAKERSASWSWSWFSSIIVSAVSAHQQHQCISSISA